LTPIIKSWPSEWVPKSNNLAIQVLGGHGYTNEHPVEMFYRDNRLNPIHEGTTGIQSLDLLCRKVPMKGFLGYTAFLGVIEETILSTETSESLGQFSKALANAVVNLRDVTDHVMTAANNPNTPEKNNPDLVFSNSVSYLNMFGHITIAWLWLRQADLATKALATEPHIDEQNFYQGKLQAMKYFFNSELPLTFTWGSLVKNIDSTSYDTQPDWL